VLIVDAILKIVKTVILLKRVKTVHGKIVVAGLVCIRDDDNHN
jgi:hypothetical protein